MKKALVSAAIFDIALYVLQFLIIPLIYANVRQANEGAAVVAVTTVIISAAGMLTLTDKIGAWFLGFALYVALMIVYTPEGAYRIGITGVDLDGLHGQYDASKRFFGIAVVAVYVVILQLGTWGMVKLIKISLRHFTSRVAQTKDTETRHPRL
jgi:hypothetical protein